MTRSESLALLHEWARSERSDTPLGGYVYETASCDRAYAHGAAAVRAITLEQDAIDALGSCNLPLGECLYMMSPRELPEYSESRLAFRAALNAVGIRGAL